MTECPLCGTDTELIKAKQWFFLDVPGETRWQADLTMMVCRPCITSAKQQYLTLKHQLERKAGGG